MPQRPAVAHVRRPPAPRLIGRTVARVDIARRDVIRLDHLALNAPTSARIRRGLLEGCLIRDLRRRGKQLAIIADGDAPALLVQLGMSGQLIFVPAGQEPPREDHLHVIWRLAADPPGDRLIFRDPRRFGGLTPFNSRAELESINWTGLGPDALTLRRHDLRAALTSTRRPIKAALLDQQVVAGIGNIYADESLIRAGIHPLRPADTLTREETARLCQAIRTTLARAIGAGGTTLRDYVDGNGRDGRHQTELLAYGRSGLPCRYCGSLMEHLLVAQRTTTFCPQCQPPRSSTSCPQHQDVPDELAQPPTRPGRTRIRELRR